MADFDFSKEEYDNEVEELPLQIENGGDPAPYEEVLIITKIE